MMDEKLQCSEEVYNEAMGLPPEEVHDPNRKVNDVATDMKGLVHQAEADKVELATSNFDTSIFPKVGLAITALQSAQGIWTNNTEDPMTSANQATVLNQQLQWEKTDRLGILDYAVRGDKEAEEKLRKIRLGSGRSDMVQDTFDMLTLAQDHEAQLLAINEDVVKFVSTNEKAKQLQDLTAAAAVEAKEINELKDLRNRLYCLVTAYGIQIRDVGKFVFRNDSDHRDRYNFQG